MALKPVEPGALAVEPFSLTQPPEQLRYARWLEWGTRFGLALLIVVFLAYGLGLLEPHVPHARLPEVWNLPVSQFLAATGLPDGWGWLNHAHRGDIANLVGIGVLAGMFGIGAGWANVPALNLLMGAPLKVSAGTSGLVLSLVDSSAAWVYVNKGAVLPMIAVPSVIGMMLGAKIGARLLDVLKGSVIRRMVIGVLLFAGMRALLKGTGVWP